MNNQTWFVMVGDNRFEIVRRSADIYKVFTEKMC